MQIRKLGSDLGLPLRRLQQRDLRVGFCAGKERFDLIVAIFLEPEDGVDAGLGVPMKQDIREVPSVVDDDVIGLQNLQVAHGAEPFVGMGGEVEIKGQLGLQLIEATEQALRIVGVGGGSGVAASEQCNAPRSCLLKRDSFLRFSVGECLDVREKLAAGV